MKRLYLTLVLSVCLGALSFAQNTFFVSGGNVNLSGNYNLVLNNTRFINNGTFNAGTGTVRVTGTGTDVQSAIGGTGTTTFYNLEINKTTNGSRLEQAAQVNNELRMTAGNLDLNNNDLTLGTTSGTILGESETSHITGASGGMVIKAVTLNAPTNVNPGNMGMVCSSNANIGALTIRRGHIPQTISGSQGIARFFEIDSPNNQDLDLTLQFNYLDAELNGNTETSLGLWRQDSSFWFNPGITATDPVNNSVTVSNMNLLTKFTLAPTAPKLALRVFLEGPYSTTNSMMNDGLRTGNVIPTREPYTALGYAHGSITGIQSINPFVFNATTSDAIVDWIIVELRSTTGNNPVVAARSALLQRDGDIVDLDGRSVLSFPGISDGSYYMAIRHRNHLGIRSLNTVSLTSTTTYILDFTTSTAGVLGGGNGLKQVGTNFAMFIGDFNGNGQIQNDEINATFISTIGLGGYFIGDMDMNGQVQNEDLGKVRPNTGRGAQFSY